MAPPRWLSAIQRSVVWLGATAWVAYLKKPAGANLRTVRADSFGWIGGSLLIAGLAFHFWSNVSLARGEMESAGGSNGLVVRGPYRYVRNPIYLAGIPLLVGACFLYSTLSKADLAAALVLMAFFHLRVVRFEEPALRRRFGQSYDEYCRRVPRWMVTSSGGRVANRM
jgi:protein-S-isoprenylcysteine O-methyltransferase Ste14